MMNIGWTELLIIILIGCILIGIPIGIVFFVIWMMKRSKSDPK